ncbi:MAG: hypothetical protein ACK5JT_07260 [Hyphomicrobiaceae bacterium]
MRAQEVGQAGGDLLMRYGTFIGLLAVGGAIGFGAVLALESSSRFGKTRTDLLVSLEADRAWVAAAGAGWGATSRLGTVIAQSKAVLDVPMPEPATEGLIADVVARPDHAAAPSRLALDVNGVAVGQWVLKQPRARRWLIPAEAVKGKSILHVTISTNRPGAVIVQEIRFKDPGSLTIFAGHVDTCQAGTIVGWAISGDMPAPLTVYRNGVPTLSFVPDIVRPGVTKVAEMDGVGFQVALKPQVKPGEKVEVRFPNGKPVRGAVCKP